MSIKPLPHWAIVSKFPAYYDTESLTVLEQTARLYAKMSELVESYNKYIAEINTELQNYETEQDKTYNTFVQSIVKITSDYIATLDLKITQHDRKWAEYYEAFTTKIIQTTKTILKDLKENGELDKAVLEAIGELDSKFEQIKVEYAKNLEELEQARRDLKYDYDNTKIALGEDYEDTKTTLGEDYESAKARIIAEYEEATQRLNESISQTEATIQQVLSDGNRQFNDLISGLTSDFNSFVSDWNTQLTNTLQTYTQQYQAVKDIYDVEVKGDYDENVKGEMDTVKEDITIIKSKYNRYRHHVCIYGEFTDSYGHTNKIAFNYTKENNSNIAMTNVEVALKSFEQNVRVPINGFLTWGEEQTTYDLFAAMLVMYANDPDSYGGLPIFWVFCLNSEMGYPTKKDGDYPLNLLDYLENLHVIDDVFDKGVI